jgi:hypothetical protein
VAQIAASIREWGWTTPVLVDEKGMIIAGHGRVLAARQLGLQEAPVMVARGWSEAQCKAYVLADNKLAENAGWDKQILMLEVADLNALGFDLSLIGFSDRELTSFAAAHHQGLTDPDDIPDAPVDPVSRVGDVWLLGAHRLVCGDCTDAAAVSAALAGIAPHLMVTDPPYGVDYKPSWRNEVIRANGTKVAARATGTVLNDDRADWREAWKLFPGDVAYVWHSALHAGTVATSLQAAGFVIRSQIIWDKTRLVISRGDYHWRHEPAWYVVRKGKTGHWGGDRKQTTIWEIPHAKSETGHGTEKPVECMKRPIETTDRPAKQSLTHSAARARQSSPQRSPGGFAMGSSSRPRMSTSRSSAGRILRGRRPRWMRRRRALSRYRHGGHRLQIPRSHLLQEAKHART